MNFKTLTLIITLALAPAAIIAQAPTPAPITTPNPPTINQHKENQQDRIAQGLKSGQLTPARPLI
jgi:hypothetical protein